MRGSSFSCLSIASTITLLGCMSRETTNPRDLQDARDTGRLVNAGSTAERQLLGQLSALPSGKPHRYGDLQVVADVPYDAASGRSCRVLHITRAKASFSEPRLACRSGRAWFFVPDVFSGGTAE
jgi:hypothetical protein